MQHFWCAMLVVLVSGCSQSPEEQAISRAEDAIKNTLKDPYSVIFSNIYIGSRDNISITICGSMNAKNSFGGYIGPRRFYVSIITDPGFPVYPKIDDSRDATSVYQYEMRIRDFNDGWKKFGCK